MPSHEPSPWKDWRRAANRHCSTCFGIGWIPNPARSDTPLGRTDGKLAAYPCRCTQPGYEFPVITIHDEAYQRATGQHLSTVEVEEVEVEEV